MSLIFLTGLPGADNALDHFDLRDRRDHISDEYEAVTVEPVETELSTEGAVARYQRLKRDANADDLLECGIELLSLGPETHGLAIKALERACRFEDVRAEGFFWLGELYSTEGNHDAAQRAYSDSLKYNRSARTLASLLQSQLSSRRDSEAETTMKELRTVWEAAITTVEKN